MDIRYTGNFLKNVKYFLGYSCTIFITLNKICSIRIKQYSDISTAVIEGNVELALKLNSNVCSNFCAEAFAKDTKLLYRAVSVA